jgi:DNA invertase Pin-like site-specific DNA recombinase
LRAVLGARSFQPGGNGPDDWASATADLLRSLVHSYTEPHLATDNELVRNILLALLSSLAKVEAQKISDRTKAGMARAKAKGIRIGRPKLGIELRQKIAQRAAKGETPYAIAKDLGIDRHTAAKYSG